MAKGGLRLGHLAIIVLLAALVGTALGDLIRRVLPGWRVAEALGSSIRLGTSSNLDVDLRVADLTLGGGVRLSVLGGLLAALALLLFVRRT